MQTKTFVKLILAAGCLSVMTLSSLSAGTLFEDNFDKGKLNPEWKVASGEWNIEQGCLLNKDAGSISIDVDKEGGWSFSCDIKESVFKPGYPGVNVCFIEKAGMGYYQLHLNPGEKQFYYLWQKDFVKNIAFNSTTRRNVKDTIGHSSFKGIGLSYDFDKWYKLKIEFKNNGLLCLYWDNKLIVKKATHELSPDKITIFGIKGIDLYIDNVKIEEDKSAPLEKKVIFEDNFSDISLLKLSGHENNKEVKSVPGNRVETVDGQRLRVTYNFRTEGHDAFMMSKDIDAGACSNFSIEVKGNDAGHRLFVVLTDASGEHHYIGQRVWKSSDWCILSMNFSSYLKSPFPGVFDGNHWEGDKNQKIDFPIKKVTVGVNDSPDSFTGKGEIELGRIVFFTQEKQKEGIVKNTSFEEVDDKQMPIGWTPNKRVKEEDSDKVKMRLSRQEAHSGGASVYIKRTLDEEKPKGSGWVQKFKLSPDATYKASCWIKANIEKGSATILYTHIGAGSDDKSAGSASGTFDWRYYEFVFTTPKENLSSKPYVYPALFYGQGEIWIDEVKIVEVNKGGEDYV